MKKQLAALKTAVAMVALLAFAATAQAPGDVRVALVIGNSAYISAPKLLNPANDAKAMGDTLRSLGFTVVELRDGSKAQMAEAIAKVRDALKGKQGIGMLYYAGHGLQMDARNYMVPVDAKMGKSTDVAPQTVDVGSVIDAFKGAGNRMNILVLDACRDNPFGGITTGKGLAPLDAPSGTFLAYATAPGNVAEDGDVKTGNGLYTQYLLQELKKPQANIESVFKRVRFAVRKASSGRQIPWESTSLEDDFQFNDGRIVAAIKPTAQQLQAEFNLEAQDWDRIKTSTNPDDFFAFVQKYPKGTITDAAHARLNMLARPALTVQGATADGKDQPYVPSKFRQGDVYETIEVNEEGDRSRVTTTVRKVQADRAEVTTEYAVPGVRVLRLKMYEPRGGFKFSGLITRGQNYDPAMDYDAMYSKPFTDDSTFMPQQRFDPPQSYVPDGLLQVGRKWTSAYRTLSNTGEVLWTVTEQGRVTAREKIRVQAGEFEAFRVESGGQNINLKGIERAMPSTVMWVVPDLPFPVKMESVRTLPNGSTRRSSFEMAKITHSS